MWTCPVCNATCNSSGEPFISEWAVACHIAGKITSSNDRVHKSWALNKIPTLDVKTTIPKMAERMTWLVVEEQRERDEATQPIAGTDSQGPYDKVISIERTLHQFLKGTLKNHFGDSEQEWWTEGIPLAIRIKCSTRREEGKNNEEAYAYTDLIDLQAILKSNWKLFEANLRRISKRCKSRDEFLDSVRRTNEIRKVVMHGARQQEELPEEDLQFLDSFSQLLEDFAGTE